MPARCTIYDGCTLRDAEVALLPLSDAAELYYCPLATPSSVELYYCPLGRPLGEQRAQLARQIAIARHTAAGAIGGAVGGVAAVLCVIGALMLRNKTQQCKNVPFASARPQSKSTNLTSTTIHITKSGGAPTKVPPFV